MTVSDVSGKAIANLATEELSHPNPVFHGDTLYCESEVLEVRPSQSKPDRGIVKVHTRVYKQDNTLVAEFKRTVLIPRKRPGEARRRRRATSSTRVRCGGGGARVRRRRLISSATASSAASKSVPGSPPIPGEVAPASLVAAHRSLDLVGRRRSRRARRASGPRARPWPARRRPRPCPASKAASSSANPDASSIAR